MTDDKRKKPLSPAQQVLVDRGVPLDYETARRESGVTHLRLIPRPKRGKSKA